MKLNVGSTATSIVRTTSKPRRRRVSETTPELHTAQNSHHYTSSDPQHKASISETSDDQKDAQSQSAQI
jgi:hypothetical protein